MFKFLGICGALVVAATGSAKAQQREAVLQRIEVPGSGIDLLVATPKAPRGPIFDYGESPDALVIYLIGGELALGFEDAETMLKVFESLKRPLGALSGESRERHSRMPVAIYVAPMGE